MTTREALNQFYAFASERVAHADDAQTLDELYLTWRMRHPTDDEFADSVAAIREAAAELRSGQTGRPARLVLRDLCEEFGVALDE